MPPSVAVGPTLLAPAAWPPSYDERDLLHEWTHLSFRGLRSTTYRPVLDADGRVIRAESRNSASLLFRPLDLDPRATPLLTWRWRVVALPKEQDLERPDGDDGVRLHLGFRGDWKDAGFFEKLYAEDFKDRTGRYPPRTVLQYVWSRDLPVDTVIGNPRRPEEVKELVVRSGSAALGLPLTEERDLVADYRRAFGVEPPRLVAVGIMLDSDDTGGSGRADFGFIRLRPRP